MNAPTPQELEEFETLLVVAERWLISIMEYANQPSASNREDVDTARGRLMGVIIKHVAD